jgi:hypothetical protein
MSRELGLPPSQYQAPPGGLRVLDLVGAHGLDYAGESEPVMMTCSPFVSPDTELSNVARCTVIVLASRLKIGGGRQRA